MDVFLLGAGRPARGQKPSALKYIAKNTKAIDWQLHSFEAIAAPENIHFMGGYHVTDVISAHEMNIFRLRNRFKAMELPIYGFGITGNIF